MRSNNYLYMKVNGESKDYVNIAISSEPYPIVLMHTCVLCCSVVSDSLWTHGLACQAPLSVGFNQARIVDWVAISSSRESSQLQDQTCVSISCIGWKILYHEATWGAHNSNEQISSQAYGTRVGKRYEGPIMSVEVTEWCYHIQDHTLLKKYSS